MPLRRVIKVGGSLWDWPRLGPTLQAWLATCAADESVLLAGGGPAADWVRQAQLMHGFSDQAAHWLAIRAMQLSAGLLAELLPQAIVCMDPAELATPARGGRVVIFDPLGWLEGEQGALGKGKNDSPQRHRGTEKTREEKMKGDVGGGVLPASWDVTSDSIAAHLAGTIAADELVLLKSALPQATSIAAAAAEGYIDRWLPNCWRSTVRCVNLRAAGWPEGRVESEK
ncbi:MAG TPA: hypothetical protein VG433_09165 [Pirellulales bacterium]|jgi:hypothetical protein|nr:hypothetical protein [Pirellulales bacterium]